MTTNTRLLSSVMFLGLLLAAAGVVALPSEAPTVDNPWSETPWGSAEDVVNSLPDIPLSKHAANGHEGQYNAAGLVAKFALRKECRPLMLWVCPTQDVIEVTCDLRENLTGGVVVGYQNIVQIVTGYAQRSAGWRHRNCVGPWMVP